MNYPAASSGVSEIAAYVRSQRSVVEPKVFCRHLDSQCIAEYWYVSVKDKQTGEAAAKVVKASNSRLDISAGASGIGAKQ